MTPKNKMPREISKETQRIRKINAEARRKARERAKRR